MKPNELHCTSFVLAVRNFLRQKQEKGDKNTMKYLKKLSAMGFPVKKIVGAE
jgi:hypothetical protein